MKIALLFYGRIRHYEKKFAIKALSDYKDIDIFYSSDNEPEHLINDFIKLYNPVSFNNDTISYDVDFGKYPNNVTCPVNINNMTRHFINLKRVFQLLEDTIKCKNIEYDIIIVTRLDLNISKIDLSNLVKDSLYIPFNEDHCGINDRFVMGYLESIKKYMNIFDNCLYLLDNKLSVPHPECLTLANIKYSNINIIRFNLHHNLVR